MTKENSNIDDNGLDDLLRKSFLENDQSNLTDDHAKFVFEQEYDVKINPEKEKEFVNKLSGKKPGRKSLTYILLSVLALTTAGIIIFIMNNPKAEQTLKTNKEQIAENTNNYIEESDNASNITEEVKYYDHINEDEKKRMDEIAPLINNELKSFIFSIDKTSPNIIQESLTASDETTESEDLILNEKVILRFKNIKRLMLERLIKKDRKLYIAVDPGQVNYIGEQTDLTSFYIRNCAITNLEYKTFLIDLLMQGRENDYNIAKVKSDIWKNYNMPSLAENYFKGDGYTDFPVINISQEGSALFCSWLEQEAMLYAKQINKNIRGFTVRLPYDTEWMHLATIGYMNLSDYEGYHTIFDINEGYIDKTLERRIKTLKKRFKKNDPLNEHYATNRYGMNEAQVIEIFSKAFNFHNRTPSDTIYPKRMKDFGKFGHVSEMILEKKSDKQMVYGTVWKDKEEYTNMLNDFIGNSGSPFVGMRIVIVYDNAPVYKDPFW